MFLGIRNNKVVQNNIRQDHFEFQRMYLIDLAFRKKSIKFEYKETKI